MNIKLRKGYIYKMNNSISSDKKYLELLKNLIDKYRKTDCEIEIHFGSIYSKNRTFVTKDEFDRVFCYVRKFAVLHNIEQGIVKYYKNSVKSIESADAKISIVKKDRIFTLENPSYNYKITVANESCIDKVDESQLELTKQRLRHSFIFENLRYDLSIYTCGDKQEIRQYNIEIEFINNNLITIHSTIQDVENILKCIQNTSCLITTCDYDNVLKEYRNTIKKRNFEFIGPNVEPLTKDRYNKEISYCITEKLDGSRYILFVSKYKRVYIISKNKYVIKLPYYTSTDEYKGTIFDGEWYNGNYHIFDCLYFKGVRCEEILNFRLEKVNEVVRKLCKDNEHSTNVIVKKYFFGNLYDTLKYLQKSYKCNVIDGYIFQPIVYDSGKPLKYKIDNTIDFKIKKIDDDRAELYCLGGKIFPIKQYSICDTMKGYTDNTVIEFKFENDKFIPVRERYDKVDGNYIDVATDNFNLINNPFDIELLKQCNMNNYVEADNDMRFTHYVRRVLLSKYSLNKASPVLVDVNLSMNNDLKKYIDFNYRNVYIVNNDTRFIEEMSKKIDAVRKNPISKNFDIQFINYKELKSVKDVSTIVCFNNEDCSKYILRIDTKKCRVIALSEQPDLTGFVLKETIGLKGLYDRWASIDYRNIIEEDSYNRLVSGKNVFIYEQM